MESAGVKQFKRDLRSYRFLQEKLTVVSERIRMLYDALGGVHSPKLDSVPVHSPPDLERQQSIRDEIDRLEATKASVKERLRATENLLNLMPQMEREAVFRICVMHEKSDVVAKELFYSESTLRYRISRAIDEALKKGG